jgi:hypothetical protein
MSRAQTIAAASLIQILLGPLALSSTAQDKSTETMAWHEIKGQHFLIYHQGHKAFANKVLQRSEKEYHRITRDLGIRRYGNFWLWGKRVKIYIHQSKATFMKDTGAHAWVGGRANYVDRVIRSYAGSEQFLDTVLPHELTHLIFREFVGFSSDVPLWLDEGVAQWEEVTGRERRLKLARRLHQLGRLLPIDQLTRTDIRRVPSAIKAVEFYSQAVSLVGFMIEKFGPRRFRTFCGHLRDGKSMNDALKFAYPSAMRNTHQLESAWTRHLEASSNE